MPKGSKADKRRIQIESELRERHPEWGADYALLAKLLQEQRGDGSRVPAERVGRKRVTHLDLGPYGRDGQLERVPARRSPRWDGFNGARGTGGTNPLAGAPATRARRPVQLLEGHWAMLSPPSTNGEYDRARELIESLRGEDRELIELRHYDGLSLRGIARLMGVSHTAVAKRLRRIERELASD